MTSAIFGFTAKLLFTAALPPLSTGNIMPFEAVQTRPYIKARPIIHMAEANPVSEMSSPSISEPGDAASADMLAKSPADIYQSVLRNRVKSGPDGITLFDYAGAKAAGELAVIQAYVDGATAQYPTPQDLENLKPQAAVVFWANLYNALTLKVVLENYPVKSIKEIKSGLKSGPWGRDAVTVAAMTLSLDDIEHGILRKNTHPLYPLYGQLCLYRMS